MPTDTQISKREEPTHSASAAAPPAAGSTDELSLLDLLIVLAERRSLILRITAACTILAVVTVLILPVRYTATTILLPPQQNSTLSAALSSQMGSLGSMAMLAGSGFSMFKNPNDMYVGMLKSETVEDAVIDKFALMREYRKRRLSDTRKKLENYVAIDGDKKDGLIRISVEDHDAQRAADLANGYVDAFRHLSEGLAITEAAQRRKFFGDQLEQAKDQLAGAEEALKQTEQSTGLIQLDSQARALIESAASLRAQITAKEVQIQAMSTYATGDNAQLVQAQQELDSLRTELARLGGSESSPDSLIVPKGKVPEAGIEYVRKLRDVKYYETIFEILARQFELAKLDEAKEGALVQVVDPALKPDRKSFPKRTLTVIVAFFVGLFLGVVTALTQAGIAQLRAHPESGAKLALLREILRRKRSTASSP